MSGPKFVVIDGKPIAWRELLKLRREQREQAKSTQLALFELKEDTRPQAERTAAGRYQEPSLFTLLED
jgi:hypothetical protein